jgi:diguanylate cyclase (GGDEF)-like protein
MAASPGHEETRTRSGMTRVVGRWFGARSEPFLTLLCLFLIIAIAGVDHLTGPELEFEIVYLVPVAIASWYIGGMIGNFFAIVAAAGWFITDITAGHAHSHVLIGVWNVAVRLAVLMAYANLLAAMKRKISREVSIARVDALTGLLNSRGFFEIGERLVRLAERHKHPITIAYIDLDNFKEVNDRYGHNEGDRLLCSLATCFKRSCRRSDVIARLGGDEFAFLFPETGLRGGEEVLRLISERSRELAQEKGWPVTFSAGAVTFEKGIVDLQEAVRLADHVMYSVKRSGKDDLAVCTPEGVQELEQQLPRTEEEARRLQTPLPEALEESWRSATAAAERLASSGRISS